MDDTEKRLEAAIRGPTDQATRKLEITGIR